MSYIVAGRVNKIQSFIGRSFRLREVIGASYLLLDLDKEVEPFKKLDPRSYSGGGNFRLYFNNLDKAKNAQNDLFNWFEAKVGGQIKITLEDEANGNVIQIRETRHTILWHIPYQAICQSCGTDVATTHKQIFSDEAERYRCDKCEDKAIAVQEDRHKFLEKFIKTLNNIGESKLNYQIDKETYQADAYADGWDGRRYVAYMVADGNSMGDLFTNARNAGKSAELSRAVGKITQDAVAKAVHGMIQEGRHNPKRIPALPLILGGDDIFVLMPAPWALDVAQRFAKTYEDLMSQEVSTIGIAEKATIGVAVVICKTNYPYKTAFHHAHNLLEKVKDASKERGTSMVTIDWIAGSNIVQETEPLFYSVEEAKTLLTQRYDLRSIPNSLLEQSKNYLINTQQTSYEAFLESEDCRKLNKFLESRRRRSESHSQLLTNAMSEIGDHRKFYQLLRLWDFMYDLQYLRYQYTEAKELAR